MGDAEKTCLSCAYWHQLNDKLWSHTGECRRHAPEVPKKVGYIMTGFPIMRHHQWCGDYKQTEDTRTLWEGLDEEQRTGRD